MNKTGGQKSHDTLHLNALGKVKTFDKVSKNEAEKQKYDSFFNWYRMSTAFFLKAGNGSLALCFYFHRLWFGVCRESCGVCGFLSPFNIEIQKSANGDSFTDLEAKDFHCGITKPITEINGLPATSLDVKQAAASKALEEDATYIVEDSGDGKGLDLRTVESSRDTTPNDPAGEDNPESISDTIKKAIFCSGTVISDRWILSAAHCYDNFGCVPLYI